MSNTESLLLAAIDRKTNGRRLPRSLAEIDKMYTYQSTTASLNPDLACQGCPSRDTRAQVTDTTVAPWDAIGMLARAEQAINKCALLNAAPLSSPVDNYCPGMRRSKS